MASGAKVLILDDCVIKVNGGDVVDAQARWLRDHESPGVVKVLGDWHGGYAMERLDPPTIDPTPDDVLDLLTRYVWPHPSNVGLNWDEIIGYAKIRSDEWWPEVHDTLVDGLTHCIMSELRSVCVHGDPTYDNVMERYGDYVLIDPIPAKLTAPDLMAVDIGKILQSCYGYGYESIMRGMIVEDISIDWLDDFPASERHAAKVFALYHVVRLLPYLRDDALRRRMKDTVGATALRLCV